MPEPLVLDRCPRCGGAFRCGRPDPGPCGCTTLKLDDATRRELAARYAGCLCLACLQAITRGEAAAAPAPDRAY